MAYTILIHGGAGNIHAHKMSDAQQADYTHVLRDALNEGAKILKKGGKALDAVETAVCVMEDSPLFNAGKGAVFTADGRQEMDAAIMCGAECNAGAVTCVQHIKNPIKAARRVLEKSSHVLLTGAGAEAFCRNHGIEMMPPDYFFDQHRWDQLQALRGTACTQLDFADKPETDKFGTVGAVACDSRGHVAAATSTGGMTNKLAGRVGDTPIIGAGCYANNTTCAVSCTGEGEYFIRGMIAHNVAQRLAYQQVSLQEAAQRAIDDTLMNLGGSGGLIAVDAAGNMAMPFNTAGMFRGMMSDVKPHPQVAIFSAPQ